MLTGLLRHYPWSRGGPLREPFTAVFPKSVRALIVVALLVVYSLAHAVATSDLLAALPWPLRLLCGGAVFVAGMAACLALAYAARSYERQLVFAKHLTPGTLVFTDGSAWFPTLCAVDSVFLHHGATDQEVRVGLVDGRSTAFALEATVDRAQRSDLFARFRDPAPDARARAETPDNLAHWVLGQLWEMRGADGVEEVDLDELTSAILSEARRDHAFDIDPQALEDSVKDCERLRLLSTRTRRRALGDAPRRYGALTEAGEVHLAAWARERDMEIYDDAAKEEMIMKVNNWGNFINNSPGAAANIGSGSATGGSAPDILPLLAQLVTLREELAAQVSPDKRDELFMALDDLGHELEHPAPQESKLRQYARVASTIAGGGVSALLGNAGWAILAPWLAL